MAVYAELALLKKALKITDDVDDDLLNQALASASRSIDTMTGRRFDRDESPSARVFTPDRRAVPTEDGWLYLVDDIADPTGLVVESGFGDTWTVLSDVETQPDNAAARGEPVTALHLRHRVWGFHRRLRVTAAWGWPAVPAEVVQACLLQAGRLFRRKDSPEGVMGGSEWGVVRVTRVDPDVLALIQHLKLPGIG